MKQKIPDKQRISSEIKITIKDPPTFLHLSPLDSEIIFFDIETTGGNAKQGKIIEIAALKYHKGKKISEFYSLVNPNRPLPKITQSITGIKNSDLYNQPPFDSIAQEFTEFLGNSILCSHGAIGDYSFLKHEIFDATGISIENYYICTHLIVSNFFKDIPSKSLSGVAQHFGLRDFKAHRALADAEKTAEIFWKLYEKLNKSGITQIKDLLKLQGDNLTLTRLGPQLDQKQIEKIPVTSGLFYFFNENRELVYISASRNLKKSILGINQTKDEKEILRLLAESNSFHFERSSHFLESLIQESNELRKNRLPIDPRRVEHRSTEFLQLLFPVNQIENFLNTEAELKEILPNLRGFFDFLIQLRIIDPDPLKETVFNKNEVDSFVNQEEFKAPSVKHSRKVFQGFHSQKLTVQRNTQRNGFEIKSGHLSEGIGWFSKPDLKARSLKQLNDYLLELFPFKSHTIQTLFNLSTLLSIMFNKSQEQEMILKRICFNPKYIFKPDLIHAAFNSLRSLKTYTKSDFQSIHFHRPKDGLAVINNNNEKNLEIYIVIKGHVRQIKKLPIDESCKLSSPRFFTRLFLPFKTYLACQETPVIFDQEACDYIELFEYWLEQKTNEGEWVDFDNLMPLFQPEVLR